MVIGAHHRSYCYTKIQWMMSRFYNLKKMHFIFYKVVLHLVYHNLGIAYSGLVTKLVTKY